MKIPHTHAFNKAAAAARDATVATLEFVGDAAVDTATATKNFIDDPSISNAVSIVTAPVGLNSQWHYADEVTISGSKMFLVDDTVFSVSYTHLRAHETS